MTSAARLPVRDLYGLLPRDMKPWALLLVGMMVCASFLEVLGLAALIPLIGLIAPRPGSQSSLATLFEMLLPPSESPNRALLVLGLCALVFIAKNAFLSIHAWLEARFSFGLYERLSNDLLRRILTRNYTDFRGVAPSKLLSTLTAEIVAVVFHGALPALTLLSEAIFAAAIATFLLFLEPQITIVVLIALFVLAAIMISVSRRIAHRLGHQRQQLEVRRSSHLLQTFTGIREIILAGARKEVAERLSLSASSLAGTYRWFQLLATMPRFVFELAVIAVLLAIIYFDLRTGVPSQTIAIQIGLFAASGFRIVIGANRIVMSIQSLRFGQQAVIAIAALFHESPADNRPPLSQPSLPAKLDAIHLANVSYAYGNHRILDNQSITFTAGTLTAVIGQSGAGKSTLLDLLAGLLPCQSGKITADDVDIAALGDEWHRHIGYVSQTPYIFADTIRRNIALGVDDKHINDDAVWRALEGAQLADFVRSLRNGLDTEISENAMEFSGGQRQRIGISRALYHQANVLLLDEPTASLDSDTEKSFMATLLSLRHERIVVLVSHSQTSLEWCDRIVCMDGGRLAFASPNSGIMSAKHA